MEEQTLKSITLSLVGRNFPVQVTEEEEPIIIKMVEDLNEEISEIQSTYPSRDKLDCVLMKLLTVSLDRQKDIPKTVGGEVHIEALSILQKIDSELSDIEI